MNKSWALLMLGAAIVVALIATALYVPRCSGAPTGPAIGGVIKIFGC